MTFQKTLHIDAPVEEVFALFADPANFRMATAAGVRFEDVRRTTEGFGTQYRWSSKVAGLTFKGFNVFTDFIPCRRITDTSSNSLEGTWTYTFEPEESGTRLHVENQVRGIWRLPVLEQVLDRTTARTHSPLFDKLKAELEK
jgi:uncharacterized protein YndB with AHSA1/START domain